jgi:hypothetical protein
MKYLLTIKWEFEAFDDMDARQKAKDHVDLMEMNNIETWDEEIKLQEIKDTSAPRRVQL